jgi:tripartite-type tricarboxylate transporter receptor subunit TctC
MGYELPYTPTNGLLAPQDTPYEIVNKISDAVKKTNENSTYRQVMKSINVEVVFETVDQYRETLQRYRKSLREFLQNLDG